MHVHVGYVGLRQYAMYGGARTSRSGESGVMLDKIWAPCWPLGGGLDGGWGGGVKVRVRVVLGHELGVGAVLHAVPLLWSQLFRRRATLGGSEGGVGNGERGF